MACSGHTIPGLESIKEFLIRLDLDPSRIPTLKEYKKAYRQKLKNHPDKGGDTAVFQGITEAALAVFQFITENQDKQTRAESDKDSALLRNFEADCNVNYYKGNVVFDIDGSKAQLWIECLTKRVGPPVPLSDGSGFKMKMEQFKIPLVSCKTKQEYGSLSVTVYPNPKTSHPKIMVQGQAYLAFVTLVLPEVFKDMHSPCPSIGAAAPGDKSDQDSDSEHQVNTAGLDSTPQDMLATHSMQQAFQRLEVEMVNIRNSLDAKVDVALETLSRLNNTGLDHKMESLEQLMRANLEKSNELSQAITELSSNVRENSSKINIEDSQLEKLATSMANNPTLSQLSTTLSSLRTEVAQSTTLQDVQSGVLELTGSLNTLESEVKTMSKKISETHDASNRDRVQIRKNSDDSLTMFDAMKKSLETLVKQAVNPNAPSPSPSSSTSNTSKPTPPTDTPPTRSRKGIMFTSSIALDINTKKLKDDLNCDLKIIPTYYVHHHPDSKDPDAYLECMVNQHLAGKSGYDFAILATGTNDITELDVDNAPPTTLTNSVADQTKTLVEVAETLAAEHNLDVFLVDKPPRFDPTTKDPTGMYSKLSKYANGVLASSVGMTPRLFIVDQPGQVWGEGQVRDLHT